MRSIRQIGLKNYIGEDKYDIIKKAVDEANHYNERVPYFRLMKRTGVKNIRTIKEYVAIYEEENK